MSLIEILSATLNSNLEIRRLAEKELLNLQSNSDNFINLIFNLLSTTDSSTSTAIKLSAALNFKNYIKLNWGVSADSSLLLFSNLSFNLNNQKKLNERKK